MIPRECKRLAEVDFPIAVVSRHSAREKSIRHGHPSTIHLWWARRPLASSRSILLGLLWPDPCDPLCPEDFKREARRLLPQVGGCNPGTTDEELRNALLRFIGDFANWDHSLHPTFLQVSRALVAIAHRSAEGDEGERPLVVDPFAGGGAIPLEALRLGCDAFASDLNPVACLILKVMLEDIPRYGPELVEEVRRVGSEVKRQAEHELADLYPQDADGATPIAYIWARTVRCESPSCGAEIPLMRSFWLCKKPSRKRALRYRIERPPDGAPRVEFEVFEPKTEKDVAPGTTTRAKAMCVCCRAVLPPDRVRAQLASEKGGADAIFDSNGRRTGGARMMTVVLLKPGGGGRHYRLPTERDYEAVRSAQARVAAAIKTWESGSNGVLSPVPDEPLPLMSGTFNVPIYGMNRWGDLFTARQKQALVSFCSGIARSTTQTRVTQEILAQTLSHVLDRNASLCRWRPEPYMETVESLYGRQALPMVWDFAEAVPLTESTGSFGHCLRVVSQCVESSVQISRCSAQVQLADATSHPLPDASAAVWFTDPPYYFAVPYADLSDFFFVWLKRALPGHPLLRDPFDVRNPLTPKARELCEMAHWDQERYSHKDKHFFEEGMTNAFLEGRRVLRDDGVGSVVFAHKTTEGWEALLSGMIRGGLTITGSWPIATEMGSRLRARESAALATSIHLICRPRPADASVGDWAEVYRELPDRIGDWMERLSAEGVRGADLVFACIGPAMEVYSRHSRVEDAEGREIPLGGDPEANRPHERGFLAYVWELVGRAALNQVLGTGKVRPGEAATGLEEDARLTALFLWTLQSTDIADGSESQTTDDGGDAGDDDEAGSETKKKGLTLVFDVVRRFAQPMGIHLPDFEHRIIEIEKGVVRLLPVGDRAGQLFGEDGAAVAAGRIDSGARRDPQMTFDFIFDTADQPVPLRTRRPRAGSGRAVEDKDLTARREATTLDRVHAAMLLQAAGRASALRTFLHSELDRGPEFLRLANALSALYPKDSEEKRLLDAMLLAVPR